MESDFNNSKRLTINDFAGEHKFRLLAWEEFSVGQGVYNNLHLHFLGNCISCSTYNNRPYIQQLSVTYPELHTEASMVVTEALDSHGAYRPNEELIQNCIELIQH